MNSEIKLEVGKTTCQLDSETFTCHRCQGEFSHVDGTWLPIGEEESKFMQEVPAPEYLGATRMFLWDLSEPEIITSKNFTCYDCLEEGDGEVTP